MPIRPLRALLAPSAILLFGLSAVPADVFADEAGNAVMARVDRAMLSPGEETAVTMTLTAADGGAEVRTLRMYVKNVDGSAAKSLIRFEGPGNIAGTALLAIARKGKPLDTWLWVPGLRQVRRLAPADRSGAFMQSDFTVEDLSVTTDTAKRTYTLLGEVACGDRTCVQVEDAPANEKAGKESGYGRVVLQVDKETGLVAQVDFYDKDGGLLKVLKSGGLVQVGDLWRWTSATVVNVQTGSKTEMKVTERSPEQVDESVFSPAALEAW